MSIRIVSVASAYFTFLLMVDIQYDLLANSPSRFIRHNIFLSENDTSSTVEHTQLDILPTPNIVLTVQLLSDATRTERDYDSFKDIFLQL